MRDIERLHHAVTMLVNGWFERVEYKVVIDGNTEDRVKRVRHDALLVQLHQAAGYAPSGINTVGSASKPSSRPPGNVAPLHLIDTITEEAQGQYDAMCTIVHGHAPGVGRRRSVSQTLHDLVSVALANNEEYPNQVYEVTNAAQRWVRKARVMLGYDKPYVLLKEKVCGECGGALVVTSDANSDVRCIGTNERTSCGKVYPQWQWLDLIGE